LVAKIIRFDVASDYFLWSYIKGVRQQSEKINELKDKIRRVIGKIEPQINKNFI